MGIGLGVVLILAGFVLTLDAVGLPGSLDEAVASHTLGWFVIVLGTLSLVVGLVVNARRTRH